MFAKLFHEVLHASYYNPWILKDKTMEDKFIYGTSHNYDIKYLDTASIKVFKVFKQRMIERGY